MLETSIARILRQVVEVIDATDQEALDLALARLEDVYAALPQGLKLLAEKYQPQLES